MNEPQVWVAIQMVPLLGLLALFLVGWHLRQQKALRIREMQHRERLAAIEKGLTVPEPSPEPEHMIVIGGLGNGGPGAGERAALATGLVLFLGGVGFLAAFSQMAKGKLEELANFAPLGLIPMLVGVGLLLYFFLSRRLDRRSPTRED